MNIKAHSSDMRRNIWSRSSSTTHLPRCLRRVWCPTGSRNRPSATSITTRRISGLIRRSLDRPAYKEKLRLRTYRTPGADTEAFVEIKKKYDHIVYKRRVAMTYSEAQAYLDGGAAPEQSQISREIDWFLQFYQGIQPAMCICYDRLALFDQYQPELRVTFDSGIRWRTDDLDLSSGSAGEQLLPHDTCLMEIKIPGTTPLWLARVLSENAIFPTHFSKYGAAYQTMLREDRSPQFGSATIHINERGEIYCA